MQNTLAEKLKENAIVLENGKPVPGFEYLTEAEAQTALNIRRSAIHKRYVSLWAQRILTMPEQALVPLKERDHLLASKFEVRVVQQARTILAIFAVKVWIDMGYTRMSNVPST